MLGKALYYPHIDIHDGSWLRSAILFWDEINTIVPTAISRPYSREETSICYEDGYLQPLRCDIHGGLLEDLGRRVISLLENPDWIGKMSYRSVDPSQGALLHADKLGREISWRIDEAVGIHPAKMSSDLRSIFVAAGGMEMIASGKVDPHLRRTLRDRRFLDERYDLHSGELRRMMARRPHHSEGEWILVDSEFANVYMSALAALLGKEVKVSPLTNDDVSSGVNLRFLIDDVAASGSDAAKGSLVSVVMKGLRVDPETPIQKILAFRRGRKDQLAEMSGLLDDLKGNLENCSSAEELRDKAAALYENKIQPGLRKLKKELKLQTVDTVWAGIHRAITVSVPAGGLLASVTDLSGSMLLGAGAFVTIADVGVKSYLSRLKARSSSPYTYLLDIERRFSLPQTTLG